MIPEIRRLRPPDLGPRHRSPEIMDDLSLDGKLHTGALRGLQRLNRLARTAHHFWSEVDRDTAPADRVRVLDVACGGGDVVLDLASHARASGRPFRFDGCDRSARAVRYASDSARRRNLGCRFFRLDVVREPFPSGYDYLVTSLFLHHLEEKTAVELLAKMAASACRGIVVKDLVRSREGYALAWVAARIFTRSTVVHHDAPVSVRAAFRIDEVRALASRAGLDAFSLVRCWPERFRLRWDRGDSG